MEPLADFEVRRRPGMCTCGRVRHGGAAVRRRAATLCVVFIDSALVFEPARALANEGDAQRLRGDLDARRQAHDHAIEGRVEE